MNYTDKGIVIVAAILSLLVVGLSMVSLMQNSLADTNTNTASSSSSSSSSSSNTNTITVTASASSSQSQSTNK